MRASANWFEAGDLQRLEARRRDQAWLQARLGHPLTCFVPVWRHRNLIRGDAAVLVSGDELRAIASRIRATVLLGERGDTALFAVDLDAADEQVGQWLSALGELADLREIAGQLTRSSAAILAQARAMAFWHQQHRFCGACGSPTEADEAGYVRRCSGADCARTHFPRTDPAVIVLVSAGESCLLGRSRAWTDPLYSTIAGFVEPGESLEDAVRREVAEETGVVVGRVSYHSSQPWPFPASLMVGFHASALRTEIIIDHHELADAAWFTRAQLLAAVQAGSLRLPRPVSIARRLLEDWFAECGTSLDRALA